MKLLTNLTFTGLIIVLALGLAAALLFTGREVPEWLIGLVLLAQVGTPSAPAALARLRQDPLT